MEIHKDGKGHDEKEKNRSQQRPIALSKEKLEREIIIYLKIAYSQII
jgi:hypothetical protein